MQFSATTYQEIFETSDQVWASNQGAEPPGLERTVAATTSSSTPAAEVAAVGKGKNKNQSQNSGQNQRNGQRNKNQSNQSGQSQGGQKPNRQNKPQTPAPTRHPTAQGDNLCRIHTKFGVNATFCAAPWQCPMKDQWSAPK